MLLDMLEVTLTYITDFMKQVIENGFSFTKNHMFLCMLHLKPEEINNDSHEFLKILIRDLRV